MGNVLFIQGLQFWPLKGGFKVSYRMVYKQFLYCFNSSEIASPVIEAAFLLDSGRDVSSFSGSMNIM